CLGIGSPKASLTQLERVQPSRKRPSRGPSPDAYLRERRRSFCFVAIVSSAEKSLAPTDAKRAGKL
ncbi:hypothetical protein, partial [Bradyrhizobium sp. 44]|uniref:hypothetical protein n=1 Tax=Bradyrhizobium sp. 44 TaxID=2782675 RepID=UPI001FF9B48C